MATLIERPLTGPARRVSSWTMTREARAVGFDVGDRFVGRLRGTDIVRFRCAGRRFVSISHPDYVDHVLHEARLKYVKSNEYQPIRATAGINLLTDAGDSWAAHRGALNPTLARRHLNGIVDLMIEPITGVTDAVPTGAPFDIHQTMVEATLRVVANSLFSQDFGPLVESMNDLSTRGLRHAGRLQRFGLWGLMPPPVYEALHWLAFSGVRLPPPLRDTQDITLTLDRAVDAVIDHRLLHPTDSADLLNVLLKADGGTWPRRRIRDEALTFMLAGHGTSPRCGPSGGEPSTTTSPAGITSAAAPPSSFRSTTFTTTRAGGPTRKPSTPTGSARHRTVPVRRACRSAAAGASASDRASPSWKWC
jgi:cytochrome P450